MQTNLHDEIQQQPSIATVSGLRLLITVFWVSNLPVCQPAMKQMWRVLMVWSLSQGSYASATDDDSCAAGGCKPEVLASPRQHHWPVQKGTGSRTGYSPHIMPNITKGPAWTQQAPYGDVVRGTPLIDDQQNIYVTTVAGRSYKLSEDGTFIWFHETGSRGTVPGVASLYDSAMLLLTKFGYLIAVDIDTGAELWATQIAPMVAGSADCALLTQGLIIVAVLDPVPVKLLSDPLAVHVVGNNRVMALKVDDGSVVWTYAPKQTVYNFQGATIHDGTFVFQDMTGGVYRLSTEGRLIWYSETLDRESGTTAGAVIQDGRVFVVSNLGGGPQLAKEGKGVLHVYDYEDGAFLWLQDLPYEGNQAVAVGNIPGNEGRTSLILGMGKNPEVPIIVKMVGWMASVFPFFGVQMDVIFLPFHLLSLSFPSLFAKKQGRSIVALDAATGKVLWYYEMEPYQRPAAMGDSENLLERMKSLTDGSNPNNEPWCLPDANAQPVIDGEGTAFVPFQDGKVYALRDENGDGKISPEEVREHLVGAAFQASPAMAPGLLAVVDCSGRVEVFRAP